MQVTLRALVWDFAPEQATDTFNLLRQEWGVDGISFVAVHPAETLLLPNASRRPWVRYGEVGAVCFLPEKSWYAGLPLLPPVSELCEGRNWLKELTEAAKKVGLLVSAVLPCCFNPAIGRRCPDLTVQNALGDRLLHALCPSNPVVRQLLVSLVGDLTTNYPLDTVELEALGFITLSKSPDLLTDLRLTPAADFLLSRCYCEHCCRIAQEQGVEVERVRFFTQTQLEEFSVMLTELTQAPLDWKLWSGFAEGQAQKFIQVRMDIVSSLLADLVEEAAHKHDKRVHVEGQLSPATLWQYGLDRQRLAELAHAVEVDAKEIPPDRLAPYLTLNRQVLGERTQLWVRLHPSERFVASKEEFLAQVRACQTHGVDGIVLV
ncbi:MAG: hypothetical protein RJAPGHWK_002001, partial [Candidatus Fervidibacter sp.]